MSRKRMWVAIIVSAVVLASVWFLSARLGLDGPRYEIIDLGTLGGPTCYPQAVNNRGQVVGQSTTSDRETHAFIWDATAGMREIGGVRLPRSMAKAINDSGLVVCMEFETPPRPAGPSRPGFRRERLSGLSEKPPLRYSFLWSEETGRIDFKSPEYKDSSILDITDRGIVLCASRTVVWQSPSSAEVRSKSYLFDADLELASFTIELGTDVTIDRLSNSGTMLGQREQGGAVPGPRGRVRVRRGKILVEGNQIISLEIDDPDMEFGPKVLNDRGEVLGLVYLIKPEGLHDRLPMVWSVENGHTRLESREDMHLSAASLNNRGQIVGGGTYIDLIERLQYWGIQWNWVIDLVDKFSSKQRSAALLWEDDALFDLNDWVDLPRGFDYLTDAVDINDKGWIVAVAEKDDIQRGVLLIPHGENPSN